MASMARRSALRSMTSVALSVARRLAWLLIDDLDCLMITGVRNSAISFVMDDLTLGLALEGVISSPLGSALDGIGSLPLSLTIEKYIGSLMLSAALDGSTLSAMLNGLGGSTLDASLISALSGLIGGSTLDSSMLDLALDGLDCVIVDDNIDVFNGRSDAAFHGDDTSTLGTGHAHQTASS